MQLNEKTCRAELERLNVIPRKYYGQVFTVDTKVINKLIKAIKSIYRPGTRIVEIGGGLGYITQALSENFNDIDALEIDEKMCSILKAKLCNPEQGRRMYKKFTHQKRVNILHQDILKYRSPSRDYLLVGNIPFHISGRLYRRFMSEEKHKPYGMVFITDKQYARTLMGQPPRCYRISLQAQAYGDIETVADVPPSAVYPQPKVMSCIMKITHNPTLLPKNFWKIVNYHFENFPTKQVTSPKMMSLQDWIQLAQSNK